MHKVGASPQLYKGVPGGTQRPARGCQKSSGPAGRSPLDSVGLVFNIQRFSLQDGPGLRTTVFLKGCPLACVWCHNPESQSPGAELLTLETRCIQCGACSQGCPFSECCLCGACVEACPTGARRMVGTLMGKTELLKDVLRDRIFFDQSGGGVTFSGGEPLMQADFVFDMAKALKAKGIHTALDTCGFARTDDLLCVATQMDLVLFDLKLMDEARHREATGESNALILANLQALAECHSNIWIRVPIIPGINDDQENLEATGQFVARLPGVRRVDLLAYHTFGASKFKRLGKDYALDALQPPSQERMDEIARGFRAHGLEVTLGGRS